MSADPAAPTADPTAALALATRSATSMILLRRGRDGAGAEVLMGRRGAKAAFMASKYVFPGGAVDPEDLASDLADAPQFGPQLGVSATCLHRLSQLTPQDAPPPAALITAGLRELVEETGLRLQAPVSGGDPALRFVFRAITPPGRSRRFDARFLLANGNTVEGDASGFARASGELSDLRWIGLDQTRSLDLPFITQVILAEIRARLNGAPDQGVPFFDNSTDRPAFRRLL